MITITIKGRGAQLVSAICAAQLRGTGLAVKRWVDVKDTKKDTAECHADAAKERADVLILAVAEPR